MTRTQLACYSLLASSFVLAALLLVQLQGGSLLPSARAGEVVTRTNLTLLMARTRPDEESLFVLDDITQKVLVYKANLSGRKGRIELAKVIDLQEAFSVPGTTKTAPSGPKSNKTTKQIDNR